ncbi:MAG: cyclic nucleotide-binding domain-containing protein [Polyangiaceae bacterium]|nr:cyclic nucleotide-binding domain-containing protein [Polyangiaceae bacterium]
MEALARTLGDHPFFRDISPDHLEKLASCAHEIAFPAGAVICREGKPATSFYLLRTGRVVLEINAAPRGAVRVESLGAGDVVGLSWLYPPYRWHTDVRVVEPVTAVAIDATCLRAKLDDDPALGYAVSRSLVHQLYERLERVRLQRLDVYRAEP